MDQSQYTTLRDVLATIPDPRKARGKRHAWGLLLTVLAGGLASGHQTAHAIAQWVVLQAEHLHASLPELTRLPSESTLLRTLRQLDVTRLEAALADLAQPQAPIRTDAAQVVTPCGTSLTAHAVDGKAVRGATACGAPTHLVRLVQHGQGVTLAQVAVAQKRSERHAVRSCSATAT